MCASVPGHIRHRPLLLSSISNHPLKPRPSSRSWHSPSLAALCPPCQEPATSSIPLTGASKSQLTLSQRNGRGVGWGLVAPEGEPRGHGPVVSQTFHLLVWVPRGPCPFLANLDPGRGRRSLSAADVRMLTDVPRGLQAFDMPLRG